MASTKKVNVNLPSNLAFQKGVSVSDGLFFNQKADGSLEPLNVKRHGIRGTQNISPTKSSAYDEINQIQETDTAKCSADSKKLIVKTSVGFHPLKELLHACSTNGIENYRSLLESFLEKHTMDTSDLKVLASRYLQNIINGRWLWRNRFYAEDVQVTVSFEGKSFAFKALNYPLNVFKEPTSDEQTIIDYIVSGFTGKKQARLLVSAEVDFGGGAIEVFPSQNYTQNKPNGFARSLYWVGEPIGQEFNPAGTGNIILGQAALRDQKISNAIRTIDSWYKAGVESDPIPVEPNGANIEVGTFLRDEKSSGFTYLKRIGAIQIGSEESLFVLACIIRGGVYGEADEEKEERARIAKEKAALKKANEAAAALNQPNQPDFVLEG